MIILYYSGDNLPSALHLPKVENAGQLDWFAGELNTVLTK